MTKLDVLDQGWVELQDMMGDDLAIVNAARVSFLGESKGEEADKRLLFRLLRDNHTSPFEMVEFKFRLRAPLMVYWQWVRHRTFHYQSVNSQSGRYTEFDIGDFYVPTVWRLQSSDNKQASEGVLEKHKGIDLSVDLWNHCVDCYNLYEGALEAGVAREQARLFLPGFAMYYTWIVKVDALNLMHFLKLRLADDAQWEIRQYALAIWQIFAEKLPWTAEAFKEFWL